MSHRLIADHLWHNKMLTLCFLCEYFDDISTIKHETNGYLLCNQVLVKYIPHLKRTLKTDR
jgi:hypothetical protein